MPINRYSDLSVSAYNPMSMEELAMVPMMKRKQHDELDKQLAEAVVKVDPLKYHEEEALRLKNEMEGKVASQAEQLASQGITPGAKSSFYKLNKEYRDLVAPTGQVGKINRAKEIYDKEHAAFVKNAMDTSKIGGDQAELRWNEHVAKNYTGYEDPEQKRIKYIDPLGAIAHQDQDKDLALAHSILGSYTKQVSDAGYHIGEDKFTGLLGVINSKGETVRSNNFQQVNEALKGYSAKWLNPSGEGYKWSKFAGQDIENNRERIKHEFNSMLKSQRSDESSTSFNPLAGQGGNGDDDNEESNTVGVPMNVTEVGKTKEEYDQLDKIGTNTATNVVGSPTMMGAPSSGGYQSTVGSTFKHTEISDPYLKKRYIKTYNRLRAQGVIPSTMNADNPKAAALVKSKLINDGPITLADNVITTDNELNYLGFPGTKIGKDNTSRTKSVVEDLKTGSVRKFIDPKTGESKTWNQMIDAGYKPETTSYYGYMSPHSHKETKFGSKSKNVSQHQITIEDEDGNSHTTEISRTRADGTTNDIEASNALRKTYQEITVEPNEFTDFKGTNPKMKGVKVAYVTKDTNGNFLNEPKFAVKKGGRVEYMTESQYMKTVYKMYQ
jgi:hypothetical protein